MSFSEGDCTSSLGWPPCVHRTSDRERSEVLCTKRREIGIAQNSCARRDKAGTAENSGDQPASCLMRSARRPKASFTYSSTLGSAPCVRSES